MENDLKAMLCEGWVSHSQRMRIIVIIIDILVSYEKKLESHQKVKMKHRERHGFMTKDERATVKETHAMTKDGQAMVKEMRFIKQILRVMAKGRRVMVKVIRVMKQISRVMGQMMGEPW
jgi:hypothetical protein